MEPLGPLKSSDQMGFQVWARETGVRAAAAMIAKSASWMERCGMGGCPPGFCTQSIQRKWFRSGPGRDLGRAESGHLYRLRAARRCDFGAVRMRPMFWPSSILWLERSKRAKDMWLRELGLPNGGA